MAAVVPYGNIRYGTICGRIKWVRLSYLGDIFGDTKSLSDEVRAQSLLAGHGWWKVGVAGETLLIPPPLLFLICN